MLIHSLKVHLHRYSITDINSKKFIDNFTSLEKYHFAMPIKGKFSVNLRQFYLDSCKYLTMQFLLIIFSLTLFEVNADFGCLDENGKPIDWFYLYKLPERKDIYSGLEYIYLTSTANTKWHLSTKRISDLDSFAGHTISQLFGKNDVASIMYNDQPPPGRDSKNSFGHSKGVIAADSKNGFWMIHSVPGYPLALSDKKYEYPTSGQVYGQSFLCITMNEDNVNKAAEQLLYNKPYIYSHSMPAALKTKLSNFEKAIEGKWIKTSPHSKEIEIKSNGGSTFKSFGKSSEFNNDLYANLVASNLKTSLYVESWRKGVGNMPASCGSSHKVYNIKEILVTDLKYPFSTTHDHSKWAVGETEWICIGDINRQDSQKGRGGGTVCQNNKNVHDAYKKLIHSHDTCSKFSRFLRLFYFN